MSRAKRFHYSDEIDTHPTRPLGTQRGPTTDTVLSVVRELTADEKRQAGLFAASVAIRQGWAPGVLAEVVDMLGIAS